MPEEVVISRVELIPEHIDVPGQPANDEDEDEGEDDAGDLPPGLHLTGGLPLPWHLTGAEDQHVRHQQVEGRDGDQGQGEVDDEAEDDPEGEVPARPPERLGRAHVSSVDSSRFQVGRHSIQGCQTQRQSPDATGDDEGTHWGRAFMQAHRVDYGHIAVPAEGGQCEDGHPEREALEELVQLTDRQAIGPPVEAVVRRREWHGCQDQQQVPGR